MLRNFLKVICYMLFLIPCLVIPAKAHAALSDKIAIVIATFGTSYEQAIDPVEELTKELQNRYPKIKIVPAYTSHIIIKKLHDQNKKAETLPQVLSNLSFQGYNKVVVQSMHITPGEEFENIQEITKRFSGMPKGINQIVLGLPLIGSDTGAKKTADLLLKNLPEKRKSNEAVVFVGHGAMSPSGTLAYPALQAYFWAADPLVYVGTIEGSIEADTIIKTLTKKKIKKAWLVPLLTIAGDHAQNDIYGDGKNSWKKKFEAAKITCIPVKHGLIALPIAKIWADNTDEAFENLQ